MGLRVGGLVGGEKWKLEKRKRWKRKEQQRWLLCTQTTQKTWTDEARESPEKVKYKWRSEDGCGSERGWKREEMNTRRGENQWRGGMEVVIAWQT